MVTVHMTYASSHLILDSSFLLPRFAMLASTAESCCGAKDWRPVCVACIEM